MDQEPSAKNASPAKSPLSVLKFGGSSLSSPMRIQHVAKIIAQHLTQKAQAGFVGPSAQKAQAGAQKAQAGLTPRLIVVVSAMGKSTNQLMELATEVSPLNFQEHKRELDMLLTAGERISMALVSMALKDLGHDAVSLTGSQSGIITSEKHGEAQITEIRPIRIEQSLSEGKVVIVAGFQGVNENKDVTTLGRGGSDTTAVALGSHFNADCVYIYTDVAGVYDHDPNANPQAKKIEHLSYEKALEMAENGAKVLHPDCIRWAQKKQTPVRVLSSFLENDTGTLVIQAPR